MEKNFKVLIVLKVPQKYVLHESHNSKTKLYKILRRQYY